MGGFSRLLVYVHTGDGIWPRALSCVVTMDPYSIKYDSTWPQKNKRDFKNEID